MWKKWWFMDDFQLGNFSLILSFSLQSRKMWNLKCFLIWDWLWSVIKIHTFCSANDYLDSCFLLFVGYTQSYMPTNKKLFCLVALLFSIYYLQFNVVCSVSPSFDLFWQEWRLWCNHTSQNSNLQTRRYYMLLHSFRMGQRLK